MKLRSISVLTVGLMLAGTTFAQHVYTLDECIEAALQNNVRMKNAENDLKVSAHERKNAFTNYFPTLSASGGGFMSDKPVLDLELAPGMGLSMLKNGIVGGVSAAMPVFTGGQIVNGNKLAKENVEKYRLLRHQSEYEVELTVENYFWQAVVAQEKLRTIAALEKQLAQLTNDVTASVEAGVTTRNDLLQVQLRSNETLSARLSAENACRLARRLLAQYIGAGTDSVGIDFVLADSLPRNPGFLYTDPEEALYRTDEYNLMNTDLRAKRIEHRISVGKNLPTVAVGGGYGYNNLLDKDCTSWIGFVTVSVPLSGWWGGAHDIKKHKLEIQSAENTLADGSDLLKLRMESTWDDLTDAYRNVEIAQVSISQSAENLRLNTDYYAAGTCSMSDLLEAQTLYRQSRDRYVEAYAKYQIKKREYLQATGR